MLFEQPLPEELGGRVVLLDGYFFEISINSFRKDIGFIHLEPCLIWESKELAGKDQQQENTYERAEISVA